MANWPVEPEGFTLLRPRQATQVAYADSSTSSRELAATLLHVQDRGSKGSNQRDAAITGRVPLAAIGRTDCATAAYAIHEAVLGRRGYRIPARTVG